MFTRTLHLPLFCNGLYLHATESVLRNFQSLSYYRFSHLFGTRRFITMFKRALHLPLFCNGLYLHAAESVLRNSRSLSHSRFSQSFWNPKVHYRFRKGPPLVPVLSQVYPVLTTTSYLRSILMLSSHLRLSFPSDLFSSGFPTKILYEFLFSPMRATCSALSSSLV
jgi:hypothetical protein